MSLPEGEPIAVITIFWRSDTNHYLRAASSCRFTLRVILRVCRSKRASVLLIT